MKKEQHIPFTVAETRGGESTYITYRSDAAHILRAAYPEIGKYKIGGADKAIYDDFLNEEATLFLLLHHDSLVGFCSYAQMYACSAEFKERDFFSWTREQWLDTQKNSASTGWTVIHPDFQSRGGWSQMMDVFDASLLSTQYLSISRQVRKANKYAQKVAARYKENILFQTDIYGYGPQTHFRIAIPRT